MSKKTAADTPAKHSHSRLLVCVGGSKESRAALRYACSKARQDNLEITLLHVLAPAEGQALASIADKLRSEQREEAKKLLAGLSVQAEGILERQPETVLREGPVGDEILSAVQNMADVGMVVLGAPPRAKNHGKLVAWLSGQLGERLFIPVILVPGTLTDQQIQDLS